MTNSNYGIIRIYYALFITSRDARVKRKERKVYFAPNLSPIFFKKIFNSKTGHYTTLSPQNQAIYYYELLSSKCRWERAKFGPDLMKQRTKMEVSDLDSS